MTRTPSAAARKRTVPHKRAPGRPTGRDGDLRSHLLDAALARFARDGIAATSLRGIAAEAGVTPALLNYYFGNRQQMQAAVISERVLPAMGGLRAVLVEAGDDVGALVTGFVRAVGALVAVHPWLPPLWVREVLCEGGALREALLQQIGPLVPQQLARRFTAAQARGALNPDLDPRLLVVSLVGLTLFPAAGAPIWQRLFAADDLGGAALQEHTIALLARGLELDHAR